MRVTIWIVSVLSGVFFFSLSLAWAPGIISWQRSTSSTLLQCSHSLDEEWEEEARSTATTILQSVFLPTNATRVERAVKVGIRSIKSGQLRKRVSQLVLGTSIMRKRHEYVYNTTIDSISDNQMSKIRCMVDLHAEYLNDVDISLNVSWPTDPVKRIALQYSMPDFLVQAWVSEYGVKGTEALCTISNKPGPITLRRNSIQCCSDDKLVQRLVSEEGVTLSPPPVLNVPACFCITSGRPKSIWAMSAWKDGWLEVQDVGSQWIVAVAMELDDDNNTIVVDYCAGNGGKTLAMISQLHGLNTTATVWAHDVSEMRLKQLRGSLSRAGVVDSQVSLFTTSRANDLEDEMADVVLVDAPCSSCGVLRRQPSHRWELTQQALEHDLPQLQLEILSNASRLVKPGGRLVYATCSLCRHENEQVANALQRSELGCTWEPWPFSLEKRPFHQDSRSPPHYCKLLPHKHNTDGFFIARWRRKME